MYGDVADAALQALTVAMARDDASGKRLSDFDEMIYEYAADGQSPCERGDVLFVDEFQDSTLSQLTIVKAAIVKGVTVVVLGDDSQSVFGFAGATFNTIHSTISWAETKLVRLQHFKLLRNHRSTNKVVAASELLLPADDREARVGVIGNGTQGVAVRVADSSGATVSAEILKLVKADSTPPERIVVLRHRNWTHDDPIVVKLRQEGVKIHVAGQESAVSLPERILAIVQVCNGLEDYEDETDEKMRVVQLFLRNIRGAMGCPPPVAEALKTTLERSGCDIDVLLTQKQADIVKEYEAILASVECSTKRQKTNDGNGSGGVVRKVKNLITTLDAASHVIKGFRRNVARVEKGSPPLVVAPLTKNQSPISSTWEPKDLTAAKLTGKLVWTLIRDVLACKVVNAGTACEEIRDVVRTLSIEIENDYAIDVFKAVTCKLVELHDKSVEDKLILSTIHRFKGHERPIAFVTDLRKPWSKLDHVKMASLSSLHDEGCQNLLGLDECGCSRFVLKKQLNDRAMEAEAMRLMYVGASRAKEQLFLSSFDPEHPLPALSAMVDYGLAERFG